MVAPGPGSDERALTDAPESLDVDIVHNGLRVNVRPYIVETLQPGLVRTLAFVLSGIFAVVWSFMVVSGAMALVSMVVFMGIVTTSMAWSRVQRIKALRASRVGLVLYMRPHAVTLEWSRDGLPSHEDHIHPVEVIIVELFDAGDHLPEIDIRLDDRTVSIPLHGCSRAEAEWIMEAMEVWFERGRELVAAGADEVPDDLLAMMKEPDSA